MIAHLGPEARLVSLALPLVLALTATAAVGEGKTLSARKFWPHDLILGLLPLILSAQALIWAAYLPEGLRGVADFRQLYSGGYMIRTGHAKQLYNYAAQEQFEEALVPVGVHFTLPVNHLAFEELLFVPLSWFSYRTAYWIFLAFNGTLLVVCFRLLKARLRILSDRWQWLPACLFAAFFPISRALTHGQDSIILLTLLAGALLALDHESELAAGLLVGMGLFKFQIAIPIALLFVAWRRWRFSAGFAISSVAAGLLSLWLVGLDGAREYAHTMVAMSVHLSSKADMVRYGTYPTAMLNLRGLASATLNRFLPQVGVQAIVFLCSAAVLWLAARRRASLELAIAAAALTSYHFLSHDASILIIVIAAALCSGSVWNGAVAFLLLLAPMCAVIPEYGYLAAIPLLGLFLLMLRRVPELRECTAGGRESAFAEGHCASDNRGSSGN
jgi:Glycosyltransferase family 87